MTISSGIIPIKHIPCKPFLRWAGGKRWLLKDLHNYLPTDGFNQYHELFLGGGAVFFHLQPDTNTYLNDFNSELIDTYECLRDDVDIIIKELKGFKNNKEDYYKIRIKKFRNQSKRAARFIYLNQTSFNGIYRVNLNGEYNVPFGYRTKDFLEEDNLRLASAALKNAKFSSSDFAECIDNIQKNDLVFLDPPYTVAHNNNGFIKYNQKLFSLDDQYRLSNIVQNIREIGAYYILTNASHDKIRGIFGSKDQILQVNRASLIGGKNAKRGNFSELVITNI